jgi:uncharacterized membrane protein
VLSCLIAAALWAISLGLFKGPIAAGGARAANFFKCAAAALLYWIWVLATGDGAIPGTPADWVSLGISGVVGFTIGDLLLFVAVREGGVQRALVLFNTSPIMTALLGISFLGELPDRRAWFGMGLILSGVALVETSPPRPRAGIGLDLPGAPAGPGRGEDAGGGNGAGAARTAAGRRRWIATLAGLGAALGQALGILFSRGPLQTVPLVPATAIRLSAAVVTLLPLLAIAGKGRGFGALSPRRWPSLAGPTLIGTVIALLFAMRGVRDVPAGIAATLLATTPLFALPISYFALREPIGRRAVLGTLVAVAGVVLLA